MLALPYWGAVMTPYWDAQARGALVGLTGSHRRGHLYRSLLEGIALEQALVTGMVEHRTGVPITEFVAIGGGAASDLWCQIVANASGKTVARSRTTEASALGAGMCAAVGAGWFPAPSAAAQAMCGEIVHTTEPCPQDAARYTELLGIYRELYLQLKATFGMLGRFTERP